MLSFLPTFPLPRFPGLISGPGRPRNIQADSTDRLEWEERPRAGRKKAQTGVGWCQGGTFNAHRRRAPGRAYISCLLLLFCLKAEQGELRTG